MNEIIGNIYKNLKIEPIKIEEEKKLEEKEIFESPQFKLTKKRLMLEKIVKKNMKKIKKAKPIMETKKKQKKKGIEEEIEEILVEFEKPKEKYLCLACKKIIKNKKIMLKSDRCLVFIDCEEKIRIVEYVDELNESKSLQEQEDYSTDDNLEESKESEDIVTKGRLKICSTCYLKIFKYGKKEEDKGKSKCIDNKCRKINYYKGFCLQHFIINLQK